MSFYFLCPKPAPLILQIPFIYKYLDLSDTILDVSEIRIRSVFHKQKGSFSPILKFKKKNYCDRYYDILHQVARIIRQCLFKMYFLLFSVYLPS